MKTNSIAVLFDMDGVLVDSVSHNITAITHVLAKQGVDFAAVQDPHGEQWRGSSLAMLLAGVKEQTGTHIPLVAFAEQIDEIQFDLMRREGNDTAHSHLVAFLEELKQNNVPIGVGTSSRLGRVERILEIMDIASYFRAIVGAEDVAAHKPNPAVYLEVAARLGVEPRDCVVIEDSPTGIEAAQRAGMKTVGFLKFHQPPYILQAADHVVHDYHELTHDRVIRIATGVHEVQ